MKAPSGFHLFPALHLSLDAIAIACGKGVRRDDVLVALGYLDPSAPPSPGDCVVACLQAKEVRLKKVEFAEWTVFWPAQLQRPEPGSTAVWRSQVATVRLSNLPADLSAFADALEDLGSRQPNFAADESDINCWARANHLLVADVRASTAAEAGTSALQAMSVLRGAAEFAFSAGSQRIDFGGRLAGRCIPVASYILVRRTDSSTGFRLGLPASSGVGSARVLPVGPSWDHRIKDRVERLLLVAGVSTPSGGLSVMLQRLFRLYENAMDQVDPHYSLLAWWQIAEALTLAYKLNGDTKKICARLIWMADAGGLPAVITKGPLLRISEMRNNFVHRCESDEIAAADWQQLKLICDVALGWLVSVAKDVPSEDVLMEWHAIATRPSAEQSVVAAALKLARDSAGQSASWPVN